MPRITPVISENADAKIAATLSQLKASRGKASNLFPTLAHASVALDEFLSLSKALFGREITNTKAWCSF